MTAQEFKKWLTEAPTGRRPLVMGVVNLTPDSFSDGGKYLDTDAAVGRILDMVEQGADVLDFGGESTRPGAKPVLEDEQIRRIQPVLEGVCNSAAVACSIDTTRAAVAEVALSCGATIVNDISAGRDDPAMLPLVARAGAAVILMHMQGTPATMQASPTYQDVVVEVREFLQERTRAARAAGIEEANILLDPGIGFGKTMQHNLTLLARQKELTTLGRPLVVGTSRKGFIGQITGEPDPARRSYGTAATVAWAVANGAAMVRVHDVAEMKQVVRMTAAITNASRGA